MTIDRERVHELATGQATPDRPGEPGGAATAESAWHKPFRVIAAIFSAPNAEECRQLESGFGAAYRELRDFVWTRKRCPWSEPGEPADPAAWDENLCGALDRLVSLAAENPLVEELPRFFAMGRKIYALRQRNLLYVRRGTKL
jgi:hypothetical protein